MIKSDALYAWKTGLLIKVMRIKYRFHKRISRPLKKNQNKKKRNWSVKKKIAFNLLICPQIHLRIYGNSGGSVVLASAEIKVQKKTDAELLISHGHLSISATDTGIELDGTA